MKLALVLLTVFVAIGLIAEKRKAYRMRLKNILIVVKDIEESNKYLNVEVSSRAGHNRKSDRKR